MATKIGLTSDDIARNCDEALGALGGVTVTPLKGDGTPAGGSLKVDQEVVDIFLGGDSALREALGLGASPEHEEVIWELRHRRASDNQLQKYRAKLESNPAGSQIALFCRWTRSDGKFRTLLSGVVGPGCKHKTAEEWGESAMSDQRNLDPHHGMPHLMPLGYLDPKTGAFVPDVPNAWVKP